MKLLLRKFEDPASGDVNYPAFVQAVDQGNYLVIRSFGFPIFPSYVSTWFYITQYIESQTPKTLSWTPEKNLCFPYIWTLKHVKFLVHFSKAL